MELRIAIVEDQKFEAQQLERLLDPEETAFDMIRCNDALALNICSVGLDARVGTDVANYKRIPLLHGFSEATSFRVPSPPQA